MDAIKKIAAKYFNVKDLKLRKKENSYIDGLYTIGSTGSLAQTSESDCQLLSPPFVYTGAELYSFVEAEVFL